MNIMKRIPIDYVAQFLLIQVNSYYYCNFNIIKNEEKRETTIRINNNKRADDYSDLFLFTNDMEKRKMTK